MNINELAPFNANEFSSAKKEWEQPELSVISKDAIQGGKADGNDGGGSSTGS